MLNYGELRDILKYSGTVKSQNQILVEWNMNRYQKVSKYGIYKNNQNDVSTTYSASDPDILEGYDYLLYDDGTTKLSEKAEYFSTIASIFNVDRPDPGIVLLQHSPNAMISKNPKSATFTTSISSASPRFYPFYEEREYDYFNSAKYLDPNNSSNSGQSVARTGNIKNSNPFIIYENSFPCNKIVVKVQNYATYPVDFKIDYLPQESNTWTEIYSATSSTELEDGILEIYFNGSTWTTTESNLTDILQISSPTTQAINIRGIRIRVDKLSICSETIDGRLEYFSGSLELIELSPRLQVDITDYTEQFSIDSSIGKSSFGLPVGNIVVGTGEISISNESGAFLSSSAMASLNMLSPNVEFRFNQIITASASGDEQSTSIFKIPIGTRYSENWNISDERSVSVPLSDRMRIFKEKSAVDLEMITDTGVPLSVIIQIFLDNVGITGYEFKKSSNSLIADTSEDIKIKSFFCSSEQTVSEVLEQLAIATQSSMYIDVNNKLCVMTKERVASNSSIYESSTSTNSASTDFWFVGDEDFTNTGVPAYVSNDYKANIVSMQEERINPIIDGDINYHSYGFNKVRGKSLLEQEVPRQLLEDVPAYSVIDSGYVYEGTIVWEPGSDNSAVLGAANLIQDILPNRLETVFDQQYVAFDQNDAIRKIYESADASNVNSLIIFLDRNDIYLFPDFSGYVWIDSEYIEYYGKLFQVINQQTNKSIRKIFFSEEELTNYINSAPLRSSIVPIGLVIKVKLRNISKSNNQYTYTVIGDGRGVFDTSDNIKKHVAFNDSEDADIKRSNRYSIYLGDNINKVNKPQITAETKYSFGSITGFKKVKKRLGLPAQNFQTYLGTLKISGPKTAAQDRKALDAPTSGQVIEQQDKINKSVDALIDNDAFDPYIYFWGERGIHAQMIELPFKPKYISTRMRLFTGRKKNKGDIVLPSTISSIAGIGFNISKKTGTGFYLEIESMGSGKDLVSKKAIANNLRLYKVEERTTGDKKQGTLQPNVILLGQVNAFTVVNQDTIVLSDQYNNSDAVFELGIVISRGPKNTKIDIYYGSTKVNKENILIKNKDFDIDNLQNICLFVRNDSQAIYEYVSAATGLDEKNQYVNVENVSYVNKEIMDAMSGIISPNSQNLLKNKNGDLKIYYNDFARLVRQAKKYNAKYDSPVIKSKIIDISNINPQYMVKDLSNTPYKRELLVTNTSTGGIFLSRESELPLYIFGISAQETTNGVVSVKNLFDKDINDQKKISNYFFNKSIYGQNSFSLDSRFIQSKDQAERLMMWIVSNCSRQRLSLSMEIFPNPILELGDKVKIVSKDRGYAITNTYFGDKTFVVSDIKISKSSQGDSMNIVIVEVGED